jgi:hypothetical protein
MPQSIPEKQVPSLRSGQALRSPTEKQVLRSRAYRTLAQDDSSALLFGNEMEVMVIAHAEAWAH